MREKSERSQESAVMKGHDLRRCQGKSWSRMDQQEQRTTELGRGKESGRDYGPNMLDGEGGERRYTGRAVADLPPAVGKFYGETSGATMLGLWVTA